MTREPPRTVFFLSDFGTEDEFAGVVHAVIAAQRTGDDRHRPDASHSALRRPGGESHAGAGGAAPRPRRGARRRRPRGRHGASRHRRCEVALPTGASLAFVGPDNGLLVAAAEAAAEAPVDRVVELARPPAPPDRGSTFDGRDLFAPAAAALCAGAALEELGEPIDPASLVRLIGGVVEEGRLHDGRACLRSEVTWVDRFGNLQLAATVADARVAGIPLTGSRRAGGPAGVWSRPRGPGRVAALARARRRAAAVCRRLRRAGARGVRPARRRQRASGRGGGRGVRGALAQRRRRGVARPGLVRRSGPAGRFGAAGSGLGTIPTQ